MKNTTKLTKTMEATKAAIRQTKRNTYIANKYGFDTSKLLNPEQRSIIVAKIRSITGNNTEMTKGHYINLRKVFKVRRFGLLKSSDFDSIIKAIEEKASEDKYESELKAAQARQRIAKFKAAQAKDQAAKAKKAKKAAVKTVKKAAKAAAKPSESKAPESEASEPAAVSNPLEESEAIKAAKKTFSICIEIEDKSKAAIQRYCDELSEESLLYFDKLQKEYKRQFCHVLSVLTPEEVKESTKDMIIDKPASEESESQAASEESEAQPVSKEEKAALTAMQESEAPEAKESKEESQPAGESTESEAPEATSKWIDDFEDLMKDYPNENARIAAAQAVKEDRAKIGKTFGFGAWFDKNVIVKIRDYSEYLRS